MKNYKISQKDNDSRNDRLSKTRETMLSEIQWSINWHKRQVEEYEMKLEILEKLG